MTAKVFPAPDTFADSTAEQLVNLSGIGVLARVRPYYHVPSGPSSLTPARSPWSYEVRVIEAMGDMVLIEHTWQASSAPWPKRQTYFPRELHRTSCECAACAALSDGIAELRGA